MPSLDRPEIVDATGNLVEITEAGFGVDLEIAYATADNFTGAPVYNAPRCLLHKAAARLLRRAINIAAAQGLTLRISDAYRPPEVHWRSGRTRRTATSQPALARLAPFPRRRRI